jgi:hypothetical protein
LLGIFYIFIENKKKKNHSRAFGKIGTLRQERRFDPAGYVCKLL